MKRPSVSRPQAPSGPGEAGGRTSVVVLAALAAISGAVVGFLVAGNFLGSVLLLAAVLASAAAAWWARGLG